MKRREFLIKAGLAGAVAPALGRAAVPCPPPTVTVGGKSVTTPCAAPASPGTAPAWFTAMPDKTWIAIAGGAGFSADPHLNGNRLVDVEPSVTAFPSMQGAQGTEAIIYTWTGGCCSQSLKEVYLPAQGGHAGYFGNEVYALKLMDAVPSWQRIWGPTPDAQILTTEVGTNPPAFSHADGNPRSTHGWFHVFCDNTGRLWLTMIDNNATGAWGTNVYSIDRNNLAAAWMYHGRLYPSVPGGRPGSTFGWQNSPGAFDPVTNTIWHAADFATAPTPNGTSSIACTTAVAAGAQSQSTGPQVPGSTIYNTYLPDVMSGWSAILDDYTPRSWVIGKVHSSTLQVMDIVNNPGVLVTPTIAGTGRWADSDGAVYHAPSKALLVFGVAGTITGTSPTIYKLAITGSNPLTATYTWSTVTNDPSNTVTPITDKPAAFNGLFSKFQLIKDMGNGQGALVAMCAYRGPTYVYKLPAAGV